MNPKNRLYNVCFFVSKRTVKVSAGSLHAFDSPNLTPLAHAMIDIDVDHQNILKPATMKKFTGQQ